MSRAKRVNTHHRLAKINGGRRRYVNGHLNTIRVPEDKHRAFHLLFVTLSAQDICSIINDWIDPNYKFICVKREKGNSQRATKNHPNDRSTDRDEPCGK